MDNNKETLILMRILKILRQTANLSGLCAVPFALSQLGKIPAFIPVSLNRIKWLLNGELAAVKCQSWIFVSHVCLCEISYLRCLWWKHGSAHVMSWQQQEGGLALVNSGYFCQSRWWLHVFQLAAVTRCDRYLDALKARLKKATHRQESTVTHPPRHHAFIIITEKVKARSVRFPERVSETFGSWQIPARWNTSVKHPQWKSLSSCLVSAVWTNPTIFSGRIKEAVMWEGV